MEDIKMNQQEVDEIQSKIIEAKRTLELKEYTAVGVSLRQADELFAKMILNLFINKNESNKYFNLDKKLFALKEYGCLEKADCDVLYEVKQFGNNLAHSEKADDFDCSQAYELLPKFEKVINKYLNHIKEEYQKYLKRKKDAENEIFKKADLYITKALRLFTETPWETKKEPIYYGSSRKPFRYHLKIFVSSEKISDDAKINIKKNLYLATLNYLIALSKLNNCYKNDNDFLTLVRNLENINESTYKNHPELNGCLYFDLENEMNEILKYESPHEYMYDENHSYGINSRGKVVKLYSTSPISMPLLLIDDYLKVKNDDIKNDKCVDSMVFTEINKICSGSLKGEITWNDEIYGYIRLIHQSIETTKRKYGEKYQENPYKYLVSNMDGKIKKQELDAKKALEEKAVEIREQYEKKVNEENKLQKQEEELAKKQEEASNSLKTFGKLFAIFIVIAFVVFTVISKTDIPEKTNDVIQGSTVFDGIDYLNIGYSEETLENYNMEAVVLKEDSEYVQNPFEYDSETNTVKYVSTGEEKSADDFPHSLTSLEQIPSDIKEKIRSVLESEESTVSEKIMESIENTDTEIDSIEYEYYGDALLSNGCYVMALKGTIKYAYREYSPIPDGIFFIPLAYKASLNSDGSLNIDLDNPVVLQEHTSSYDGLSMVKLPTEAVKKYEGMNENFSKEDFSTEYYGWPYFTVKSW